MKSVGDIVTRLRDKTGLSILYQEVPTWVDPAPTIPSVPDQASTSSDSDSSTDEAVSTILYIGEESLSLTNLLLTHASSHVGLVG